MNDATIGIIILLSVVVMGVLVIMFSFVEITPHRYNGWLVKCFKYIKCGAIDGHEYRN